ncbi:hypothetical protein WHR41_02407 [Cladosporium halotolerans]|uniref:Uncharacterized protein n=1 Tax=Cladosporium halotolerans TaxID=1052096 RepID=A0AB34KWF6_9PEZI
MAFYDNDSTWSAQSRQPSFEQQPPPSRSGAASAMSQQTESNAFALQFEEIERATDNLMKSGNWLPSHLQAGRRGSAHTSASSRNLSVGGDLDAGRPGSAGLQGFYAGQRFPAQNRHSEAEQMLQAKRRMAAQRERELRNYHQEQQYNRKDVSGAKTDRAMSPNTMSEEDRRELIARQHRALYGDNSTLYNADGTAAARPASQDARVPVGARGASPLAFDPFSAQAQAAASNDGAVQMPPRDRANSTASPVSNPSAQQSFALLNDQQSRRTSNSSPSGSPPLAQGPKGGISGVAPIGTRPVQAPGAAVNLNKRSTTPLTPSSLAYGFSSAESQGPAAAAVPQPQQLKDERSASSASNPPLADKNVGLGGAWGGNAGVWGKNALGSAQASVWG